MAAFQFSVQQVSFPSEDTCLNPSLDSLSSVVDPNVDFITVEEKHLDETQIKNIADEWRISTTVPRKENDEMEDISTPPLNCSTLNFKTDSISPKDQNSSYPTIPLAVAHYINKNNPDICQEAERYFNSESYQASHNLKNMPHVEDNATSTSPLHSMSIASEALALQQSVIGNYGVKPVSADIVAQVVANTKLRMEQGDLKCATNTADIGSLSNLVKDDENGKDEDLISKTELIRYPSDVISSTVEKHSWFSSATVGTAHGALPKSQQKALFQQNPTLTKSSSQNSIASATLIKSHRTNETDLPKLHASNSKLRKHNLSNNLEMSYEPYPESSVDYETESSISEKFELESLCSEAFETESNFSEFSAVDDDMLEMRSLDAAENLSNNYPKQKSAINHNFNVLPQTSNGTLSVLSNSAVSTVDKASETDESHHFQLLREKASLEGRLESIIQEQNNLIKEKDHYCSLATAYEVKLKSMQNQLETTVLEKKNILMMHDMQSKEHKNWDSIIKEYQSIIEAKNVEIKALKDDFSESEQAITRSKINYEELKVDLESREGAVSGLKKKIAELHVEVQILLQGKIQLENEVKNVRLEMDTLQKSKEWFQEQLHTTQENQNKLHQQLILAQSTQSSTSNNLEKIMTERNQLKQELVNLQQWTVAEKEVLMKQLETIEADMKERESLFDDIQKDKGSTESVLVERIRRLEEEKSHLTNLSFTVSNQKHEINVLKSDCEEKTQLIQAMVKEKAQLSKHLAVLQKSSNDKDLSMQQLMQQLKDLNIKINHSESALRRAEELISTLKEERTAADVALASANEEKRVVNESLKAVSENLNKFKNNFKHMKAELITQTSQAEQLLKEKKILESTIKKNEESMFLSRKEYEQQVFSETRNRNVMFDDLKKKKTDVENVLNVYSKDLLNYQQTIENLTKQKAELITEISNFKFLLKDKDDRINTLQSENVEIKDKLSEFVNKANITPSEISIPNCIINTEQEIDTKTPEEHKQILISKSKAFLYKKLKEKIKECKLLRSELETKNQLDLQDQLPSDSHFNRDASNEANRIVELEDQLHQQQQSLAEKINQLKKSEDVIIELEKEKGKFIGLTDKYNAEKLRLNELEAKLSEKDSYAVQLACLVEELKRQFADLDATSKTQISSLELDLNKEKAVIKNLRQQVFQEKRANSHLQRDLQSLTTALDQANQIADSKKQDITSLQAELSLKMQAELKHRAEIEHFQTEIHLQHNIVEKLNKELEEVKARDPALAEQIKALSWRLKEKSNEIIALQQKIQLMEERHKTEMNGIKQNIRETESLLEKLKKELDNSRKEKFNYQSKVIELRKALKSKLAELESKGILRVENKSSSDGPVIHLNIPDPEVSFDESYVNDLLQKSMQLSESRPLSNLQECLNSLKEEMVQLQKKIIDSSETV